MFKRMKMIFLGPLVFALLLATTLPLQLKVSADSDVRNDVYL